MNKTYVLDAFIGQPWAILPAKLALLQEIVLRHVAGEKLDPEQIQARLQGAAVSRPPDRKINNVAVLPLFGSIIPRADMFEEASGATSAESFGAKFDQLVNDPAVDAIVLDVNSPGGQVGGIPELAQKIFEARGTKPIIAVANQLMASAAYWVGTAADQLVVTPSGEVGSVGVFSVHNDMSAALEKAGLKLSIISAGKYKVEANPYEPLTADARTSIQGRVSDIYDAFVAAVAQHRGVSPEAVRTGFGEGRVVSATQAVASGMADRVATLEEIINELVNTTSGNLSSGQAPVAVSNHLSLAQARLAQVQAKIVTGDQPMIRELLQERQELLARANAIAATVDAEQRDMTDAEREEFQALLGKDDTDNGKIGALDARIAQITTEREKLRAAAEKKFVTPAAEKPTDTVVAVASLTRAEFNKLSAAQQAAFVRGKGKLTD